MNITRLEKPEGAESTKTVLGVGPEDAKILLVAEAPGRDEVIAGEPLVGWSGNKLNQILQIAGIPRHRCRIENVFQHKALGNNTSKWLSYGGTRKYPIESSYYLNCKKILFENIRCLKEANIIVALGGDALWALLGLDKITKRRGSVYWSEELGIKVMPTLHPAALLPGRNPKYLSLVIKDMRRALRESKFKELRTINRNLITEVDINVAMDYLLLLKHEKEFAFDIEVLNNEVSHISFATSATEAISISFVENKRNVFTEFEEVSLWQEIATLLEDETKLKIAQNAVFDSSFLFMKYGIRVKNIFDTMIAQVFINPDLPKGLDMITSVYTDEPYYKDDLKMWTKTFDGEELFKKYSARDSAICAEVKPPMIIDLNHLKNLDNAEMQMQLIEPLVYMSQRGIKVDETGIRKASEDAEIKINELKEELNQLVGREINPNSPKALIEYFYDELKIPPYKKRSGSGKGNPTVDVDALKRLKKGTSIRKGRPEAGIILDIRHHSKRKGTYFDIHLLNGRLIASWNPVGTKQHRFSSGKNIFGYGTNLENQPIEMKEFLVADPGYLAFEVDLKQADLRVNAHIAPEHILIDAFETGADPYRRVAAMILDKPEADVTETIGTCFMCPDPSICGHKGERFGGKKAALGFNYGWGYKMFAYKNDILEGKAKFIRDGYLRGLPGIENYWRWIQHELKTNQKVLTNCFGASYKFLEPYGYTLYQQAYSYIPQSTVADVINWWGVLHLWASKNGVELLNQVHDSVWFQIPIDKGFSFMADVLLNLEKSLMQPITWKGRTFQIPVEAMCGKNFKDMEEIDLGKSKEQVVGQIKNVYRKLN